MNGSLFINPRAIKGIVSPNKMKMLSNRIRKTLLAKCAHTHKVFSGLQELWALKYIKYKMHCKNKHLDWVNRNINRCVECFNCVNIYHVNAQYNILVKVMDRTVVAVNSYRWMWELLIPECSGAQWSVLKYINIMSWVCGFHGLVFLPFSSFWRCMFWKEGWVRTCHYHRLLFSFVTHKKDNIFHTMAVATMAIQFQKQHYKKNIN